MIEIVCCKTTPLQRSIYEHLLSEKARIAQKTGKQMDVLACITALKKLCNHPKLIFDAIREKKYAGKTDGGNAIDDNLTPYFHGLYDGGGSGRGGRAGGQMCEGWEWHGGKFAVLARLLHQLRTETSDRIVIISNYTQTLDLVEILCRQNNYPSLRLDGGTSINKRQKLVNAFNDLTNNEFIFLLSSKAGGCGINLVGGNRLVLFDPDWNPANDKQAAARCWPRRSKEKVLRVPISFLGDDRGEGVPKTIGEASANERCRWARIRFRANVDDDGGFAAVVFFGRGVSERYAQNVRLYAMSRRSSQD